VAAGGVDGAAQVAEDAELKQELAAKEAAGLAVKALGKAAGPAEELEEALAKLNLGIEDRGDGTYLVKYTADVGDLQIGIDFNGTYDGAGGALRPSRSVFEIVHLDDSDCPEQSRSNELRLLRREVVREASLRPDAHAPLLDPARYNLKQCCAGFSIVVDQTRRVQLDDGTSCEYWDMLGGNFAQKINGGTSSLVCPHLICSLRFDVCHRAAY
jgi:hypothetical protein